MTIVVRSHQILAQAHNWNSKLPKLDLTSERWNSRFDFCGCMEITTLPDDQTWNLIRFNQKLG